MLITEILRMARRLTLARDALLRGFGITPAQLRVLKTIHRMPVPFTISALVHAMDLSRRAARVTVHELETLGIVSLAPDPHDAKAQLVVLTPSGRARLEKLRQVEDRWITDLIDGFDDHSLAHAASLICIVREGAIQRTRSPRSL